MLNRRKKYFANSKRRKYLMKRVRGQGGASKNSRRRMGSIQNFFRLLRNLSETIMRKSHTPDFFDTVIDFLNQLLPFLQDDKKPFLLRELQELSGETEIPTPLYDFFHNLEEFINETIDILQRGEVDKNELQAGFLNFITNHYIFFIDIHLALYVYNGSFENSLFIQYLYSPQYNSIFSFDRFIKVINKKYGIKIDPYEYTDVTNFDQIKEAIIEEISENIDNFIEGADVKEYIKDMFKKIIKKENTNKKFLRESIEFPIKFKDITTQGFYRRQNIDENVEKKFFKFLKDIKDKLTYKEVAKKVPGAIIREGENKEKINPAEGVRVGSEFEQEIKTRLKTFGFEEVVLPNGITAKKHFKEHPEMFKPGTFVSQPNGKTNPPDFYIFFNEKMLKLECKSTTSNSVALGSTIPDQETLYLVLKADHRDLSGDGFCTFFYGKNLLNTQAEQDLTDFKDETKSKLEPEKCLVVAHSSSRFSVNLPATFNDELRFLLENYVLYASDFFDTYDIDDIDDTEENLDINFVDLVTGDIVLYTSELIEEYKSLIEQFRTECGLELENFSYLECQEFIIKNPYFKRFFEENFNKKEKKKIKVKRNFNDDYDEICCCVDHSNNLDLRPTNTHYKSQNLKLYKIDDDGPDRYICHICLVNNVKNHNIQRWTVNDKFRHFLPVLFFFTDTKKKIGYLYAPRAYNETKEIYYQRIATKEQLKKLKNSNGIEFRYNISEEKNLEKWMRNTGGNVESMNTFTREGNQSRDIRDKLEKIIKKRNKLNKENKKELGDALKHILLDDVLIDQPRIEEDIEEDIEEEQIDARYQEFLREGMQITDGDGDCFFHSLRGLILQYYNTDINPLILRRMVVDKLRDLISNGIIDDYFVLQTHINQVLGGNTHTIEDYYDHMRRGEKEGGGVDIINYNFYN